MISASLAPLARFHQGDYFGLLVGAFFLWLALFRAWLPFPRLVFPSRFALRFQGLSLRLIRFGFACHWIFLLPQSGCDQDIHH